MSASDIAFIRAYAAPGSQPVTAPTAPPPRSAPPALPRSAQAIETPIAASAAGTRTTTRTASIHVGLGSVVPAPHAAFVNKISAAMASAVQDQASGGTATLPGAANNSSTRAPLSSFSAQLAGVSAASASPRPALEIDAVRWPAICQQVLVRCPDRFAGLVEQLRGEVVSGTRTLAITGVQRREGRTTLALCLARQLAAANIKVALVDADFANPKLANQLSIGVNRGWEAVLCGEESPWDVMIESLADRISILPLGAPATAEEVSIGNYRIAATLNELAENYDLVLIDAGCIGADEAASQWLFEPNVGIQATILAYDARRSAAGQVAAGCLQIAQAGLRQLGLAEIFTAE